MANLKEIRNRIVSISSTMQITSAMKMVSAAKLRKAQDAITQMRPYANKLKEILENLSSSLDSSEGVYSEQREVNNVLIVAVTSNRGLCGAFNANIIKRINAVKKEKYQGKNVEVLSIGKKAYDHFKKNNDGVQGDHLPEHLNDSFEDLNFDAVAAEAEKIMQAFVDKKYDEIVVVYNQFKNAAMQLVQVEQFLPVLPPETEEEVATTDYIFEPSKEYMVEELIPKSLKIQLYKAVLDSNASEHGARMTAMHKATDNASDLIGELKLSYNKARQAAITGEILEIVAGAEALN